MDWRPAPVETSPVGRRLGLIAAVAIAFCVGSLVVLTLLIPQASQIPQGGLVPVTPASATR